MLVVISYDRRYNAVWQILDSKYQVIKEYPTRQEAIDALKEIKNEGKTL